MNPLFNVELVELADSRQQDLQKWLTRQEAAELRDHIEAQIKFLGAQAMQQALDSAEFDKMNELSKDLVSQAQQWRRLLQFWDTINSRDFKLQTIKKN